MDYIQVFIYGYLFGTFMLAFAMLYSYVCLRKEHERKKKERRYRYGK